MKSVLTCVVVLLWSSAALAHPGHFAEVAGHGHWLGAAALGAAIALGAWAALKGKKAEKSDADDEPQLDDEELQEA
jgi:hydrogenase/urease accessory protein HupE